MSTVYGLKSLMPGFRLGGKTFDYAAHNDFRQTILHIAAEIKTFSQLSGKTSMFFPSRINAAHASIVGHAVNRQHVSSRSGVNRMGIGVPAKVIKTGNHRVVQPLVDHI